MEIPLWEKGARVMEEFTEEQRKRTHRNNELYAKNDYMEFSRGNYYNCSNKLQRPTEENKVRGKRR